MALIVEDKMYNFYNISVPILPKSWYRACFGLDTVSGEVTVVVNGLLVAHQVFEEFDNSVGKKPISLKKRIMIGKMWPMGFWYQSRGRVANVNVFSSKMPVDLMNQITDGDTCGDG